MSVEVNHHEGLEDKGNKEKDETRENSQPPVKRRVLPLTVVKTNTIMKNPTT